jgi:hypothetical protein
LLAKARRSMPSAAAKTSAGRNRKTTTCSKTSPSSRPTVGTSPAAEARKPDDDEHHGERHVHPAGHQAEQDGEREQAGDLQQRSGQVHVEPPRSSGPAGPSSGLRGAGAVQR